MKHALLFCFFSVFIIGLANCECITDCTATYTSALVGANAAQLCTAAQNYLKCLSSCGTQISTYLTQLKNTYVSCDLSGYSGSTSPSVSFLTLLVAPLFAAYRTFGL